MDPPLPNGDHDPHVYRLPPPVNSLPPLDPEDSSHMNGYSSYYDTDPRILPPNESHHFSTTAPAPIEDHHPRHNAIDVDSPNNLTMQSFNPLPPPTYPLYSQEPARPVLPTEHPHFLLAPTPPSPSFKALGKRRASSIDPPHTSEYIHDAPDQPPITNRGSNSPAPPYTAPTPVGDISRPKPKLKPKAAPRPSKAPITRTRVMPSRQRRGTTAHGIGSNPIDAMIIEAQQRAAEHEPIVDPDAVFLITTDPKGPPIAGPSTGSAEETGKEDERYFEREEVAKNMRQQAIIQTPEFCLLSEVYQPSSRLRTRTEVDGFDSSDAAYERRHRKPEMLEKRQRRREKDKLEHERYKLRERVEQLRTMDVHHFRALLPSSQPTLSTDSAELEHIRSELLAHADDLIRRYDVLLPPDPRAANGQRLRLKEWEIRREGNRFIPLTDEAASELAAAGLLDEQSAAEAAAAGILITATGPGLPALGGKGAKGYGSGFRPNLVPSEDEDEAEVEGETTVDIDGEAEAEPEEQPAREEVPEPPEETLIVQPVASDTRDLTGPVLDIPPRPSSGALKIKLKVPRPSTRSSDLSQDTTRPSSEQRSTSTQNETCPPVEVAPSPAPAEKLSPPPEPVNDAASWTSRGPPTASRPAEREITVYSSPAPSATPPNNNLSTTSNGVWTELPYHDVPYEHQSRDLMPMDTTPTPVQTPAPVPVPASVSAVSTRVRTPRASTPAPAAVPALLAAAEREANRAAGGRARNLRTAEAFGVKLPRGFEEEKEFTLPSEWINQHIMAVDEDSYDTQKRAESLI